MAEAHRDDELEELIDATLGSRPPVAGPRDSELASLVPIVEALRDLPRPAFRADLKTELERSTTMSTTTHYVPQGLESVTPYLIVRDAAAAIDFYRSVFDASEIARHADPGGRVLHATLRIGTATVEMGEHSDIQLQDPDRLPQVGLHLYVEDVDALMTRATASGAHTVRPVEEQPYGDREATIADPFGIIWFVATHVRD